MAPVKMVPEMMIVDAAIKPKNARRIKWTDLQTNSTVYLTLENVHKQSPKQYKKQKMNFQT